MHFSLVFVLLVAPAFVSTSQLDIFNVFLQDHSVWKCVSSLDEACVDRLGKKPVEELFEARELRFGDHLSIEKVSNRSLDEGDAIQNIWDFKELMNAGVQYLTSHALKIRFGDLEARMFQSPSKTESVELTLQAGRRASGKSRQIYRVIIPLVIGFKITGLVIFGIVAVKFFLLKAAFIANTAMLVAGGIVMKKLYDHGMGMLTQHQAFLTSHHSIPSYYANNHDFSSYGFNGYNGNSFEAASSLEPEVTDPGLGASADLGDLHGQFSNHAIALAALNKTLAQQQFHQQQQPTPKRRWSHKWSPYIHR